jgi:hypothetical protein
MPGKTLESRHGKSHPEMGSARAKIQTLLSKPGRPPGENIPLSHSVGRINDNKKGKKDPVIHNKARIVVCQVEKHLPGLGSIQPLCGTTILGKTRLICATTPKQRNSGNLPRKRLQIRKPRGSRANYTGELRMNPFRARNILLTARQTERGREKAARRDRTDMVESDPIWNSISQRGPIHAGYGRLGLYARIEHNFVNSDAASTHGCCPREWSCQRPERQPPLHMVQKLFESLGQSKNHAPNTRKGEPSLQ